MIVSARRGVGDASGVVHISMGFIQLHAARPIEASITHNHKWRVYVIS